MTTSVIHRMVALWRSALSPRREAKPWERKLPATVHGCSTTSIALGYPSPGASIRPSAAREERRVAPDGEAYSQSEFASYYGEDSEWEEAKRVPQATPTLF